MYEPDFLKNALSYGWSMGILTFDKYVNKESEEELAVCSKFVFRPLNFRVHEYCASDFLILDINSAGLSPLISSGVHAVCFTKEYEVEQFGIKYKTMKPGETFKIKIKNDSPCYSRFRASVIGLVYLENKIVGNGFILSGGVEKV